LALSRWFRAAFAPAGEPQRQQSKEATMSITELRATSAMPIYEPLRRIERRPEHADLLRRDRDASEHSAAGAPKPLTTPRERFRGHVALVVLWAGLAVAIVAYAIARESIGALVLALFVAWLARMPWTAAWSGERDAAAQARRITFIP
jgi:hypothetical protein